MLLTFISDSLAAIPAGMYLWNLRLYAEPFARGRTPEKISVLIPARNEEHCIEACVSSVLASRDAVIEVIVLDDHSVDETAAIVSRVAERDPRLRVAFAPPLPELWCGKQHACSILGRLASGGLLCFLDADVTITPNCIATLANELRTRNVALLSGFPLQETGTLTERALIPMMHVILLGYLPIIRMRTTTDPAYSAGCGQLMFVDREAYIAAGGHAAIRSSRHDGLALPRAFRIAGLRTDLRDLTELAKCRMYRGAREVYAGLSKNATEGLAAPARIVPFTLLLFGGQCLPVIVFAIRPSWLTLIGAVLAYAPRVLGAIRFRQSWMGVLVHPLAVVLLLIIQWIALIRYALRLPSNWKGRSYTPEKLA